jgi:hypothetical protein
VRLWAASGDGERGDRRATGRWRAPWTRRGTWG